LFFEVLTQEQISDAIASRKAVFQIQAKKSKALEQLNQQYAVHYKIKHTFGFIGTATIVLFCSGIVVPDIFNLLN